MQGAIDQHYASSPAQTVGGASVAVIFGSCRWVGAVGEAHTGEPMTTGHLFRIASVTKTYVAATLLALVEEGLLGLDDTVASPRRSD
ncbi:MAG: beta-lactamase family protein [Myxococcales bacterium]|nr:beta-lactamase family protein [Myxococcales bacterium]